MILGIDISTSITGFAICDDEGKVLGYDAFDMRNKRDFENIYEKASKIHWKFLEIKAKYKNEFTHIFIEQKLMGFKKGKSSPHTMMKLAEFNGIVSYICRMVFDINPVHINVISARNLVGIKIPKGEDAKKVVMKFLLDNCKEFEIEYTSHGNPKPKYYDMADAIVIAKAASQKIKSQQN